MRTAEKHTKQEAWKFLANRIESTKAASISKINENVQKFLSERLFADIVADRTNVHENSFCT